MIATFLAEPDATVSRQWRDLWQHCDRAGLFNSAEMFRAWRASIGHAIDGGILAVHRDRALVGLLPVMRTRAVRSPGFSTRYDYDPADTPHVLARGRTLIPVRRFSPVHSLAATALQPALLCRSEDLRPVTEAIVRWLVRANGWDQLTIPAYEGAESEAWQAALAAAGMPPFIEQLNRTFRFLREPAGFDALLRAAPIKFRKNVGRAERAGARENVEVFVDAEPGCTERHFAALSALAAASWKATAHIERDVFLPFEGRQEAFMRALAGQFGDDVQPFMVLAMVDGTPAAILFGVLSANRAMTLLLLFRDGRAESASPGLLVLLAALRHARDLRLDIVDLNATSDWMRHLVNETRRVHNVCAFARTMRGHCYATIRRLNQAVRERRAA